MYLKPEAVRAHLNLELSEDNLEGRTESSEVLVPVRAVLESPKEATTCGAIRFSAERSTGAAGRGLGRSSLTKFAEVRCR